ncbi:hypothetical protein [Lacticaseibacillus sp. GG6-2]
MKVVKLVLGIMSLIAGFMLGWGTLISLMFVLAVAQGVTSIVIGVIATVVFVAAGVLMIKSRKAFHLKLEGTAVGLLAALFILAVLVHKLYVDLYLQAGVLLVLFAIVVGIEMARQKRLPE